MSASQVGDQHVARSAQDNFNLQQSLKTLMTSDGEHTGEEIVKVRNGKSTIHITI